MDVMGGRISRDLRLKWVSVGYIILPRTQYFVQCSEKYEPIYSHYKHMKNKFLEA